MLDFLIAMLVMYAVCGVTRVMERTETHLRYTGMTIMKSNMSTASHCHTPTWDCEKYDLLLRMTYDKNCITVSAQYSRVKQKHCFG